MDFTDRVIDRLGGGVGDGLHTEEARHAQRLPAQCLEGVMKRPTRYRANSSLMGKLFMRRLDSGSMIDRDEQKTRGTRKNPKHLTVPESLARFFKPVGQEEA